MLSRYLLLNIVQDIFEVQVIVVVFNPFSYTALKQGRSLEGQRDSTDERTSVPGAILQSKVWNHVQLNTWYTLVVNIGFI